MNIFKRRHFKYDIIIWAVRWYCKYGINYRDLEEMRALLQIGNNASFLRKESRILAFKGLKKKID